MGLMAIAIINVVGEKLSLWMIRKGPTERSEERFRQHFARQITAGKLRLCYQISSRTDKVIAKTVLKVVAEGISEKVFGTTASDRELFPREASHSEFLKVCTIFQGFLIQ
jgi:hypothetical protein